MATSPPSSQRHHNHHRLSPSFTDSAIDVELSESGRTDETDEAQANEVDDELVTRLARIAQLAAAQDSFRALDGDGRAAVERYLDGLEAQLLDPRPQITREIARNRPVRSASNSSTINKSPTAEAGSVTPTAVSLTTMRRRKDEFAANQTIKQMSQDLTALLEELSTVNAELQQRRIEACHIHDLFTSKCEGMAQRIIELDHETHELQSDIVEDTIELEGLRGTVRGLESWIGRWQRQRDIATLSSPSPSQSRSRWKRKKQHAPKEVEDESDFDTLLDGISAWMRGWNDVEEGFRVRARRRKHRRERQLNPVQP
ncbi:hypothetical protein PISL3812_04788 [Talaromyces islandicus]|uniref:Uncharacterized protein n=1 Tax=Talaromyces islandicus TaxID=28573 RepID=A0A0U1LWH7_TALIS|nr:hypothetical protein PISL3812_04788 [Talaromyces islandicus]